MNFVYIPGGGITSPQGFVAGVAQAGIKKTDRYDMALVYSKTPATAAGVYTTNKFLAAPVQISQKHLANGIARGFVVNSGCANACTGREGLENAYLMAAKAAEIIGCMPEEVVVASTGVIGVQLPMPKIIKGIEEAGAAPSREKGQLAAQAIMTTDTCSKEIAIELELGGEKVILGGMAKGSGMIHPNMATMLGFITTDAAISPHCLQAALKEATDLSFNMITVDGDTSTNDMVAVFANGLAGNGEIKDKESSDYKTFARALTEVCIALAKMIAQDGEGATKLIEVKVENAPNNRAARVIAKTIAGSSLVKTAIFGEDANWGRIICAVGYSGVDFNPDSVDVYLGNLPVARDGAGLTFDEEDARKILQEDKIVIKVDMKQGEGQATAWGCDLSYDYVKINAAYRT
ncbi:bifunctional glutamate N-acetyltransferase/amino-acid acetyltransferase ArgJ [Thermanaerosceptrum fracticalcis]|uniref:Arginine biosynthesis bifunctional protein ArgJ n=1 Tax=Thermanaerosceptrum fracticalcis TaxID=1712410 RepID=A0A7G6E5Y6_THEFR|nr:bifunctional glutamate N-acetyltransferase/amino-acid acetyltransferase ArgJ [Thermanaerosceptrum fracticalcis]QNB47490.1 bifunctional glutamate N-acetyltransferase/amino-acid acetyltransferase ArgJ [Thermanaerosceptrum fracticalcis]